MNHHTPFGQSLIFLISLAELTLTDQTSGRETRNVRTLGTDALSLSQLVAIVVANNPTIQAAQAKWRSARERIPQAAAWDDPKVTGGTVFGRFVSIPANSFTDQGLSVEQMIPISGKNRSKERMATADALATFEEARRRSLDVVVKAKSEYYQLKSVYARLDLNRADEESLVQSVDSTRARFEAGKQAEATVLLAENERQKIVEQRKDLELELKQAQSSLNVLMNRDPFIPVRVVSDDSMDALPGSPARLRAVTLTNRPEIRAAEAKLTAANARLELAKRDWIPDPTVSFEAERYNGAAQTLSQVGGGVSISLPWLNGKKYRAEEEEARSEASAAQDELTSEQTQALGLLRNQLDKIETLHHHLDLYRDNLLPTARETVASLLADYQSDKGDLLTLLSAQRNLFDLETMYARDRADFETALAELQALAGLEPAMWATTPNSERQSK
jgi:outer membrane protein, heavy metal efflux system